MAAYYTRNKYFLVFPIKTSDVLVYLLAPLYRTVVFWVVLLFFFAALYSRCFIIKEVFAALRELENDVPELKTVHTVLFVVGMTRASGYLELALVTWKPERRLRFSNLYLVVLLL